MTEPYKMDIQASHAVNQSFNILTLNKLQHIDPPSKSWVCALGDSHYSAKDQEVDEQKGRELVRCTSCAQLYFPPACVYCTTQAEWGKKQKARDDMMDLSQNDKT
jgi:hypothetical protein